MNGEEVSGIVLAEEIIIALLLIASLVAIFVRRYRLPYTVGLVGIGLLISALFAPLPNPISPDIILSLLVPPLIFEAAFHLRLDDLQRDFGLILTLAVPGVVLTTLTVGGLIVLFGIGIDIKLAMVFGALIAATDPVAVIALFRRMGVPKRLQVLLEGESLFNDGTAIVMFNIMLAIAGFSTQETSLPASAGLSAWIAEFLKVAGGGVFVGIVLGMLASQIIGRIDDPLVETTLTTVLAYGSYLIGEHGFHVSGVLAVVVAGIVNGNVGPRGMSATTRVVVFNFWEYAAFLANSFIFLLIGLAIDIRELLVNLPAIGIAVLAVLATRALGIYGLSLFYREISAKWKHVLYWGGLRGAIALALALTIPLRGEMLEQITLLRNMAFGVVLFTLLVQGVSMDRLIKKLKLVQHSRFQEEYERRHARFVAGRAAHDYLRRMSQQGLISEHTWQRLAPIMERRNDILVEAVKQVITSDPAVEAEELDTAHREALRAQRSALTGLLRDGVISEETYSQLVGEVDTALTEQSYNWPELLRLGSSKLSVNRLMTAVIQEVDMENALASLSKLGFSVARLSSSGGFLGRKNVTLLIGIQEGREEAAVKGLKNSCQQRVEFVSSPMRSGSFPLPLPTQVTVGGATVFLFEVESYDEF
ncbi:MAG: Na+/H+ antiporter [Chloroflexota bacterium]